MIIYVMDGIYPRKLPSVSLISKFPEINVRTYVQLLFLERMNPTKNL
ncbi:DUF2071 domain-containing protein [Bacillus sp. S14(2024)]